MPGLTTEQLIEQNLADFSTITPEKHREVEHKIFNSGVKVATFELGNWQTDKQFAIDTSSIQSNNIISVTPYLKCKEANNGFNYGDLISVGTPERADSGGIAQQGIGVLFNNDNPASNIKVLVADTLFAMQAFTNSGDTADTIEPSPNDFNILLVVLYYNTEYPDNPINQASNIQ